MLGVWGNGSAADAVHVHDFDPLAQMRSQEERAPPGAKARNAAPEQAPWSEVVSAEDARGRDVPVNPVAPLPLRARPAIRLVAQALAEIAPEDCALVARQPPALRKADEQPHLVVAHRNKAAAREPRSGRKMVVAEIILDQTCAATVGPHHGATGKATSRPVRRNLFGGFQIGRAQREAVRHQRQQRGANSESADLGKNLGGRQAQVGRAPPKYAPTCLWS